jgi:succinate dehydrogenase / fumarate reductase membrane anchor subunit
MASTQSHSGLRTQLGRVRGLGSSKSGTEHWWMSRLTSLALVPLGLWFVISVIRHLGAPHAEVVAWLSRPWPAVLMILTVGVTFFHAASGLQVVIEDYVHNEWAKVAAIIAVKFLAALLGAVSIFAVLKIAFGG